MNPEEPTLLTHIDQLRAKVYPEGSGLSNIIYAGTIRSEADLKEGLLVHRRIVEEEVNSSEEEVHITGILMGQGTSVLHFLEGPCRSILNILTELSHHTHFVEGIQSGRIIYSVEDKPTRVYPEWYSTVIQEKKSSIESIDTESCKDVIHQLAMGLFEVGVGIKREQKVDVELAQYADKLPGKNLVILLAGADEFFLLGEYVEMFATPFHIELESERTWPQEKMVSY